MNRRSVLVVPGSDERKIAKSLGAEADEVVIDLEDAVTTERKTDARNLVALRLADTLSWRGGPRVAVRVNAVGTAWCHLDVQACAVHETLTSMVLPKVEDADDIVFLDRLLSGIEADSGRSVPVRIQALIETAAGLANLHRIACASTRMDALIIGYADLAAELGRTSDDWTSMQDSIVIGARAARVQAIDGPFLATTIDEDFTASVDIARRHGFDGKWVIHPRQVALVTAAFTPTTEEVTHAQAVIDALDAAASEGRGAVELNGQMLDEALARAAHRVLARASNEHL